MAIKMGKSKQGKEKKFDRSVEISAPILDPAIIKAIHSPPPEHAGFKQLLSGLNNQDSIDEVTALDDRHIPSYIGIACAVSGYTSYSSHARQAIERARGNTPSDLDDENGRKNANLNTNGNSKTSRPTSPVLIRPEQHINHITLDRTRIHSPDEERKELTQRLTASLNEHWRSPSPTIPPTEDDRHHGAYVGARYFPLTPPSQLSNQSASSASGGQIIKQIPLLGIDDDDGSQDKVVDDENKQKNEQRIASLYGEDFAKNWGEKENKMKKLADSEANSDQLKSKKSPKDLVKLKPTPKERANKSNGKNENENGTPNNLSEEFIKAANAKDKTKGFFSKMFGGGTPKTSNNSEIKESEKPKKETQKSDREISNVAQIATPIADVCAKPIEKVETQLVNEHHDNVTQSDDLVIKNESELITNESCPIGETTTITTTTTTTTTQAHDEPKDLLETSEDNSKQPESEQESVQSNKISHDGRYYLELLAEEKFLLQNLVTEAETKLLDEEGQDEISGKIRSAIGKANLLITKKFKQFEELCDANINKLPGEQYATLDDDLAGFWDMILIQVDDIKKAFNNLDEPESIGSNQDLQQASADDSTTTTTTTKPNKSKLSSQKDQERRDRLQEHINQMKAKQGNIEQDDDLTPTNTNIEE